LTRPQEIFPDIDKTCFAAGFGRSSIEEALSLCAKFLDRGRSWFAKGD
jgi:hypothetical protein